ncbi:MAG: Stp1/IreP family PP2C-type Ser/Thr phosphatase [Oscillospiraceae bacterium]|jgi:protein phosphatase|nr:Stp1/IreP family PP2C-type Ser/Thr phosphatase [Oscillospiraceae bacterium]MCI2035360.1 Stp1/IreP family PP2C-type Ser/Thr phosphatase [Oscillospiraceae bacterium]
MFKVFSRSDVGLVRKSNEDACRCGILSDHAAWAVVCDGMGGANGGNVASSVAVEEISETILSGYREGMDGDATRELIASAINRANEAVHKMAGRDVNLTGMGTTVVAAIVSDSLVHVAHAGDSRAYLILSDGIHQLTTDHSMVQEMVEKGDLTEQEARKHPQKNIITRALGVESSIRIDYSETLAPEGCRLLICTDGLTNYVEEGQIFALAKELGGKELTERLVALAKSAGGGDNITVVVLEDQAV